MATEDQIRQALDYVTPIEGDNQANLNDYNLTQSIAHSWATEGGAEYYVTAHGEVYRKGDIPVDDELIGDSNVGSELLYWFRKVKEVGNVSVE